MSEAKKRRLRGLLLGVGLAAAVGGLTLWLIVSLLTNEEAGEVATPTNDVARAARAPAMVAPEPVPLPGAARTELVEAPGAEPDEPIRQAPAAEAPAPPALPCTLIVRVVFDDAGATLAAGARIDVGRIRGVPGAYDGTDFVFERHRADEGGRLELATSCEATAVSAWLGDEASDTSYIELATGDVHEVELLLQACLLVEGRVVNVLTQQPIAGAEVWIPTFSPGDHAVSDANGRYVYTRYPAAENQGRTLMVQAEGFGVGQRTIIVGEDGAWSVRAELGFEAEFESSSAPITLDVELLPQLTYFGRVIDTNAAPVAGAAINARGYYAGGHGIFSPDTAAAVADADGFYRIEGLRADTAHTLWFRAAGFGAAQRHSFPETRANGDLGLTVLGVASTLSLTLVDPDNLPAEGFTVTLSWQDPNPPVVPERPDDLDSIFAPYQLEDSQVTDAQGAVRFEDLAAGTYVVKIPESSNGRPAYVDEELRVDRGQDRIVTLRLPANTLSVQGSVTRQGQPVPGAEVRAGTSYTPVGPVLSDATGHFRIAGQFADEDVRLRVSWRDPSSGGLWEAELKVDALTTVTVALREMDDEG